MDACVAFLTPDAPSVHIAEPTYASRLRIGIVIHDFGLGGTERIALRLANAWRAAGASVTLFCGSRAGPLAALPEEGVTLAAADPTIVRGPGSRVRLGRAAARYWRTHPIDILFVPGNFHWRVVPAAARLPQDLRPAIVAQISNPLARPGRGWLGQLWFERRMRRLLRGADALVALLDCARDDAARRLRKGRASPTTVTIPLPALADDVPAPSGPAAGRTILAAGRLVPQKGFFDLIDAFAKLDDPDYELAIVGDGPQRAALAAHAHALSVADRVRFPGYVAEIRPWLDAARLFVMPSRFEGFGAVMVEALSAGRPVVATDCTPATHSLIDGPEAGAIVPVGDSAALARAMAAQLARPAPDPEALAARVMHHRIGPAARAYLDLFEQVARVRQTG